MPILGDNHSVGYHKYSHNHTGPAATLGISPELEQAGFIKQKLDEKLCHARSPHEQPPVGHGHSLGCCYGKKRLQLPCGKGGESVWKLGRRKKAWEE